MKRLLITIIFSVFLYGQEFYNELPNLTGVSQLVIFQASISSLEDGDEIGIFDESAILNSGDCSSQYGELLVGAGVWTGSQLAQSSIGSIDNCAFGGFQLPGFVSGHPVVVKVYRDGQVYDTNLTFSAGTGTFGDLFIVISVSYTHLTLPTKA